VHNRVVQAASCVRDYVRVRVCEYSDGLPEYFLSALDSCYDDITSWWAICNARYDLLR
jgi:hypothetical protein